MWGKKDDSGLEWENDNWYVWATYSFSISTVMCECWLSRAWHWCLDYINTHMHTQFLYKSLDSPSALPVSLSSLLQNILFHTPLIKSPESRRVHVVLVRYTALYRTSPPIKSSVLSVHSSVLKMKHLEKFHRHRLLALATELLWSKSKSASLESLS